MHYGICTSYIIWDIKYLQSMYAYGITPAIHTHAHIHFQWTTYSSLAALTSIICSKKKKKRKQLQSVFAKMIAGIKLRQDERLLSRRWHGNNAEN